MNASAGHGASVRIEACGKTFIDGTRALEPATWIVLGAILVAYVWRMVRWRAGEPPRPSSAGDRR